MRPRTVALAVAAAAAVALLLGVVPKWWWRADVHGASAGYNLRGAQICQDGSGCVSAAYLDIPVPKNDETQEWTRWTRIASVAWYLGLIVIGFLALAAILELTRTRIPRISVARLASIAGTAFTGLALYAFFFRPTAHAFDAEVSAGPGVIFAGIGGLLAIAAGALLARLERISAGMTGPSARSGTAS